MLYCYAIHEFPTSLKKTSPPPQPTQCIDDHAWPTFPLIWYATWQRMFWPFEITSGVKSVCKGKICACILSYVSFPLIWLFNMTILWKIKKITFWPHPWGQVTWSECISENFCLGVVVRIILYNLICSMTTFDPTPGMEGVCKIKIFACMLSYFSFALIWLCNMTTFWISRFSQSLWPSPCDPTPGIEDVCKVKIFTCMLLYILLPLIWYAAWPHSEKVEFSPDLWPWPLGVSS